MHRILRLENTIQNYAWGSKTAISTLMGKESSSEEPQAELWLGAHPKAPSKVLGLSIEKSLHTYLQENPIELLGEQTSKHFGKQLPFLFKVLAASKALSIQSHPNLQQAKEGFERENQQGIPLKAFHRNYRDPNHKPELICALTPFWALRGFRPITEILNYLSELQITALQESQQKLQENQNTDGLKQFFHHLISLPKEKQSEIVKQAIASIPEHQFNQNEYIWMKRLERQYPDDIGVLCPVLLNLIQLQPGQAMFLDAGELHAYLDGTGIELMANSDNVLRGGLTPKHVDVEELLKTLTFSTASIEILQPIERSNTESFYQTPVREFELSTIQINPQNTFESSPLRTIELLLVTEGECQLFTEQQETILLQKGESVLIPASSEKYTLKGQAKLYKAAVPLL